MKKRWLLTLGVYCLGVATVPGVLVGVRWWQNSNGHMPKFVEIQHADAKADSSSIDIAQSEPASFLDEQDSLAPTRPAKTKPARKQVLEDDFAVAEVKPRQFDFETPTVAQNSPIRRSVPADAEFNEPFDEPIAVRSRSAPVVSKADQPDGIESLAEASPSDEQKAKLTTLREKLAELTKAKAELINEQTLEETIFSLEKQISNLHAAQKLQSAKQILRALAEEFPDSPAAAKAKRMLEAAETKPSIRQNTEPF